jgi:hypothetical protein
MRLATTFTLFVSLAVAAVDYSSSLTPGKADLKSAGSLAFGPDGILFVGDSLGAAIFAIDTQDRKPAAGSGAVEIAAINEKIAALLGVAADQILVNDLAVNPISKNAYMSVSRGKGPDAIPVLIRAERSGKLEEVALDKVKFSRAALPNPAESKKDARGNNLRMDAITDLAYVEGKVFVAGLSNEEFSSNLRSIPFPFKEVERGASIEIYHGQHGRFETNSPVRTFVPYEIKSESYLLAAYTCTPLVKFPVASLKPGTKVMGTTIAELGNRNRPLDMIIYQKGGHDFILMNNSSRGVMKMSAENLDKYEPIKAQVEKQGVQYETLAGWKGVEQLDKFDRDNAMLLVRNDGGSLDLKTVALP